MPQLKLSLLGPPHLELNGAPLPIDRRKTLALLIYLALTPQPHRRDTLATLFWPGYDQTYARANLRRALSGLHLALGQRWLEIDRESVALPPAAEVWLDVVQFRRLVAVGQDHDHPPAEVCPACLAGLTEAVNLYRDDFLTGFTLPDSPGFDDWQLFETENLRQALAEALERLAHGYAGQGQYKPALAYARRWLALDSLHEPAQRSLMQLHALAGDRAAALRQYQACVRALKEELGVSPSAETTALYERIRSEEASRVWDTPSPPPQPSPAAGEGVSQLPSVAGGLRGVFTKEAQSGLSAGAPKWFLAPLRRMRMTRSGPSGRGWSLKPRPRGLA
jgi:DNA-binding SARP family transcriptional activator